MYTFIILHILLCIGAMVFTGSSLSMDEALSIEQDIIATGTDDLISDHQKQGNDAPRDWSHILKFKFLGEVFFLLAT